LCVLVSGVAAVCLASVSDPLAKSAGFQIAERARLWMPEAFRRVMARNLPSLERGIGQVSESDFLPAPQRLRLEKEIVRVMNTCVEQLRSRPNFQEMAEVFGALAQMLFVLNLPELEGSSQAQIAVLVNTIRWNSASFRVVVYNASDLAPTTEAVHSLMREIRDRRSALSLRFRQSYMREALEGSPVELDPRSPLYGLASLVYSHSVNDLARIWLWVWKSANGDMSGRLNYQSPQ
jgi:hypothetical protein